MKPTIQLHIPKPCHENWEAMTPVAQGKFCSSCSKEVVDFSLLSDDEVLNFFKKPTGNTCGRFYSDQLQRPLQETKISRKKNWQWLLASLASLIMISKSYAQKKNLPALVMGKMKAVVEQPKKEIIKCKLPKLLGEVALVDPAKEVKPVVKKKVIMRPRIVGDIAVVMTGDTIASPIIKDTTRVLTKPTVLNKQLQSKDLPSSEIQCKVVTSGAIVVTTTSTKPFSSVLTPAPGMVKKLLDTFRITGNHFTIYPNPVLRNTQVHLLVKDAGSYQFELFDNNSRLIHAQQNISSVKNQIVDMQLPEGLSVGLYYIRMINIKNKKTYVDKVIVQ